MENDYSNNAAVVKFGRHARFRFSAFFKQLIKLKPCNALSADKREFMVFGKSL